MSSMFASMNNFDSSDSLWGCGKLVNGTMISCSSWHKVLYVAVHIGFLDLRFYFRPFDSHYKVHRSYCITAVSCLINIL